MFTMLFLITLIIHCRPGPCFLNSFNFPHHSPIRSLLRPSKKRTGKPTKQPRNTRIKNSTMDAADEEEEEEQAGHHQEQRHYRQSHRIQGRSTTEQPDDSDNSAASARWCGLMRRAFASLIPAAFLLGDQLPSPPTRVHHVWPGKNVFFLDGRVICGPDPRGLILTIISVVLSEWIFVTDIVDPSSKHPVLISAISVTLAAAVIATLLLTATRDPGITPRNQASPSPEAGAGASTTAGGRIRSRRVVINGVVTKLKYCRICRSFRPPRSSHCAVCDNCVDRFDHHCPWISQCIGQRNYRFYLLLVTLALAFYAYTLAFSARRIRGRLDAASAGVFSLMRALPETFALAAFSFLAVCFLACLLTFHAFLVAINQTSHDLYRDRYSNSPNPYNKGSLNNIKECLLVRLPPARVDFRALVEEPSG
ncbi:hypothetical protein GUJ93_ZPchr0013g37100 [Zizania palustris]|uniref:S-acyltransferase n=1 Tax=Zizania palustris TaxID=103762 RepID=A0A8J5X1U8_ZIZPA|nr:hypothetical protein GUJ93_ZPchr0013g37100 [Zizania palustris]